MADVSVAGLRDLVTVKTAQMLHHPAYQQLRKEILLPALPRGLRRLFGLGRRPRVIKEQLRTVYRAGDQDAARDALADFYDVAAAADIPEADRLARTIRWWEDAVLAYHGSDGLSNARTEAINGLLKKIKRVGHGFRNLANYRLRLLLHCGGVAWQHQPAARLRGRAPQIAA